ncbi:MAG: hypothetical protein Q8K32_07065 [Archangium sp.]|nr:hypothetical protein [Archangium sp.]
MIGIVALVVLAWGQDDGRIVFEAKAVGPLDAVTAPPDGLAARRDRTNRICGTESKGECATRLRTACDGPLLVSKRLEVASPTDLANCAESVREELTTFAPIQAKAKALCEQGAEQLTTQKGCEAKRLGPAQERLTALCGRVRWVSPGNERQLEQSLNELKGCPGDDFLAGVKPMDFAPVTPAGNETKGAPLSQGVNFETMAINGLLTFVQDRARGEAVSFALDQVSTELCAEKKGLTLFPSTCALVLASNKTHATLVPGRLFRDALLSDLIALAQNLGAALAKDTTTTLPLRDLISCGFTVADGLVLGLERRLPPLTLTLGIVTNLDSQPACASALKLERPDAKRVITTFDYLVRALVHAKAPDIERYELDIEALKVDLRNAATPIPDEAKAFKIVERVAPVALRVLRASQRLSSEVPAAELQARSLGLLSASLDLLFAVFDEFLAIPTDANTSPNATERKAVLALRKITTKLSSGELSGAFSELLRSGIIPTDWEPFASVVKFATLLVDVGSARSSDEVASVIEAAASPPGSWLSRRKRPMLGISAQFGLAAGAEVIAGASAVPPGGTLGLAVPVGIDGSIPLGTSDFTFGVMLRVLDLGALASARIGSLESVVDETTMTSETPRPDPEVSFLQVLSIGLTVSLGLAKSPFIAFLSFGYSPSHRRITTTTGMGVPEDVRHNVWTFTGGLAIDVPILVRGF